MYRGTILSIVAILLIACGPLHLSRPDSPVAPTICSTADSTVQSPTAPAGFTRGNPGEDMILPPPERPMRVAATKTDSDGTISITVPDGPLLVGGAIGVEFVARNDSTDPLMFHRPVINVQDDAGEDLALHGFLPGIWPGSYPPPDDPQILPGQSLGLIFNVQLPNADDLRGHTYHLTAQTRVVSPSPSGQTGPGRLLLVTSPSLAFVQPATTQQLHANFYPNDEGWCLQVMTGDGSRPTSPLTAEIWAATTSVATGGLLGSGDHGVWVGKWPGSLRGGGSIHVQFWVAGSEYVTERLDLTVPGH